MIPLLDVRTLVLIYTGIRIGQALVLVYLWRVQRNYPPAKDWALGALMSAVGLFLVGLRELVPVWVSEVLGNALLFPGWMIFDYGIVRAAGKQPPVKVGLTICALAIGSLAWHTLVSPDYRVLFVTQNLLFVIFDLYAAYACLKVSEGSRTLTFRLIAMLLILLAMSCLWRVAGGLAFSSPWPRLLWIAAAIIGFPMITMLLALQTSQKLQDEINDQARHDMLTGAFNRRAFDEFAKREWSRTVRHSYPFSMLMVDIDHFKQFNDQHGHQMGDVALIQVSESAQASLRPNDIWCRYGGEEFVALLPDTTIEQAIVVAERLHSSVEKAMIATPSGLRNVSVSIGVAERSSTQSQWTEVLAVSDAALYKAKAAGRNRIVAGDNSAPEATG